MGRRDNRRRTKRRQARRARDYAPDVDAWRDKTDAELLTPDRWRALAAEHHVLGVMGYAGRWRGVDGDSAKERAADARALLRQQLERHQAEHGDRLIMVSGATNAGVLAVAYAECVALSIPAAGVTAERALTLKLAPMRWVIPAGWQFGDESALFVETCDAFVVLGGGDQSQHEAELAAAQGKPVTVIRGFGGAADALTAQAVPTARIVERSGLRAT